MFVFQAEIIWVIRLCHLYFMTQKLKYLAGVPEKFLCVVNVRVEGLINGKP